MCTAATFLTRLPWVARGASGDPTELAASTRYFPLIGALIGAIGAGVLWLATLALPADLAALLALAAMILATGAFHEDGWADAFDGLFGGWTPAKRLQIMRDSRIGVYGASALCLLLLVKWQALAHLPAASAAAVLIPACAWARWSALPLARCLPYARDDGPNKPVAEGIGRRELVIASIIAGATLLPLLLTPQGWTLVLAALSASIIVLRASAALYRRRIGGLTGDCLGATNQAIEVCWLLLAVALWQRV